MAKLCELCRERNAEVPDRNRQGRPIKRICRPCHRKRLEGDLDRIMRDMKGG